MLWKGSHMSAHRHRPDPSPLLVTQESRLIVFQVNGKYSKKSEMNSTLPHACPAASTPGACSAHPRQQSDQETEGTFQPGPKPAHLVNVCSNIFN